MPIICLNISFFSDKGIEKSVIKLETPNERIPDQVLGRLKPAGAAGRNCGPEVVKLINTALEEDVQRHWAEF